MKERSEEANFLLTRLAGSGSEFDRNSFDSLKAKAKGGGFKQEEDPRFWSPKRGEDGNGSAIVRFCPTGNQGEFKDEHIIEVFNHNFEMPNGRYMIVVCPTTHFPGEYGKCPICEMNAELFKSEDPVKKEFLKSTHRKKKYITNVYVIADPLEPENEGKYFLYGFGPGNNNSLIQKILSTVEPKFIDIQVRNPFNLRRSSDFVFRLTSVETVIDGKKYSVANYGESGYKTEITEWSEEKIIEASKYIVDLRKLLMEPKFQSKSYSEIQKKLQDGMVYSKSNVVVDTDLVSKGNKDILNSEIEDDGKLKSVTELFESAKTKTEPPPTQTKKEELDFDGLEDLDTKPPFTESKPVEEPKTEKKETKKAKKEEPVIPTKTGGMTPQEILDSFGD